MDAVRIEAALPFAVYNWAPQAALSASVRLPGRRRAPNDKRMCMADIVVSCNLVCSINTNRANGAGKRSEDISPSMLVLVRIAPFTREGKRGKETETIPHDERNMARCGA